MWHRIRWWVNRARKKLWVRPVVYVALAVAAVAAAGHADLVFDADSVPDVDQETLEDLLAIIASSMLSVATLAVASMVAAYASASSTATPRAFSLVIADDVSQTALSGFIAAFIFSIVALTAVKTDAYGPVGLFVTFSFTALIFAMVIMVFLRWVDRIARLGRLGTTIDRVEAAARQAIEQRRRTPLLGGRSVADAAFDGPCVYGKSIGYVQSIDVGALQRWAEKADVRLRVESLPGSFIGPGRALARLPRGVTAGADDAEAIAGAFIVGEDRTFEEDPRFGIVTLSEIAARALSPAVNDPGTAIDTLGTFLRLFAAWIEPLPAPPAPRFDRVFVPELNLHDMFDDAFTAIARDGASSVEVGIRLQKALQSLASIGNATMAEAACRHSALAVARAEAAMTLPDDVEQVRRVAAAVEQAAAGIR